MLHGLCFGEGAGARNLVFFRVNWLQPAMKGTSSVRRLRLRSFHARICSSSVFCNEWLRLCAWFYAVLESLVADCIGMAAWLSSSDVATCVDRCRFATGCCKTHCNGCMNVAWALFWGGSRSTKPCVFPCKLAAAGDERYLVCAAVAAAVVSCANLFLLCVLQRVVASVCVVLCGSWISGCRLHWNGCMIVVMLCHHVHRDMRVRHVMLQNAL